MHGSMHADTYTQTPGLDIFVAGISLFFCCVFVLFSFIYPHAGFICLMRCRPRAISAHKPGHTHTPCMAAAEHSSTRACIFIRTNAHTSRRAIALQFGRSAYIQAFCVHASQRSIKCRNAVRSRRRRSGALTYRFPRRRPSNARPRLLDISFNGCGRRRAVSLRPITAATPVYGPCPIRRGCTASLQ